jgi:hypothetical protein
LAKVGEEAAESLPNPDLADGDNLSRSRNGVAD